MQQTTLPVSSCLRFYLHRSPISLHVITCLRLLEQCGDTSASQLELELFLCRAEQRIAARRETRLEPLCLHAGVLKAAWESSHRYLNYLHKHRQKLHYPSVNSQIVLKINVKSFKTPKSPSEFKKFILKIPGIIVLLIVLVLRESLQI